MRAGRSGYVAAVVVAAVVAGVVAAGVRPLAAQERATPASGSVERWNDTRVLELLERGRQRRAQPLVDDTLRNYRAHAEGSIYFYIDPDAADPVLMRADQVAVELYWAPPDRTRQVLLGQRIEKRLPIRDFHYYIDRLTVVQNGFGDEIQVGEGMDVSSVAHPLAIGAERVYDYRLADSLTLRLPGSEPIRAYEVEVRPRQPERPGIIGSIYLDGASGALVRMTFGFTRASYVDPRNDYVRITLDHGLWRGRYWLPHEQQVVVRRELPELDLGAGTVIRATLRVTDYEFDLDLPPSFFAWPAITAVPREQRAAYAFERGMYDDLVRDGLALGAEVRAIEHEARRLLRDHALSGLPRTRPSVPGASSLVRYNRVEGAYAGAGVRTVAGDAELRLLAGYAFAAERPSALLQARFTAGLNARVEAMLYHRELRDVGPGNGAPGVLNTLAAIATGRDYLDPYFATGGTLATERRITPDAALRLVASLERHSPGVQHIFDSPLGSRELRAVFPHAGGVQASVAAELRGAAPVYRGVRPGYRMRLEGGTFEADPFAALDARLGVTRTSTQLGATAGLRVEGGALFGEPPLQRHYFLGGAGTLPGHRYREAAGRRYALATAEGTWSVSHPWLGVRAFAAAGVTDGAPSGFDIREGDVLGSVGAGVSILHGILRVDFARGIGGGGGNSVIFSVEPRLTPWL